MTILSDLHISGRQSPSRPAVGQRTADELAELHDAVNQLPVLATGHSVAMPVSVDEGLLRADAALWDVACRHDVDIDAGLGWLSVSDRLRRAGWGEGPSRFALRALDMLAVVRASGPPDDIAQQVALCRSIGRLTAYLELRATFG
jgi:hypothetical protein